MDLYSRVKLFDGNTRVFGVILEEASKVNPVLNEAMETRTLVSILDEIEQDKSRGDEHNRRVSSINELFGAKYLRRGVFSFLKVFKSSARKKAQYLDDKITEATFHHLNLAFELSKREYALSSDLIKQAENLTKRLPENAQAHYLFGRILFFNGVLLENQDAIEAGLDAYRLAISHDINSLDFYEDLTSALVFNKRYKSAETVLISALEKDPNSSHFNHMMGVVFRETNRVKDAISYLVKSFETNSRIENAVDLALCFMKLGSEHFSKAKYYLETAVSKAKHKYGDELDNIPPTLLRQYHLAKDLLQY